MVRIPIRVLERLRLNSVGVIPLQDLAYSFVETLMSHHQFKELSRIGLWQHVTVHRSRISSLDRNATKIVLESGESVCYDKMIICEDLKVT